MSAKTIIRQIMRQFDKGELLELSRELELNVTDVTRIKDIVTAILDDIDKKGVPAEEDCSKKLEDLLVVAGFIDEDGNLLDEQDDDDDDYQEVEDSTEKAVGVERPQCYSYYSAHDPACKRCIIVKECKEKRKSILHTCFGISFDQRIEECKECIENMNCRELVEDKEN